jgi:hypothetical protein
MGPCISCTIRILSTHMPLFHLTHLNTQTPIPLRIPPC